MSDINPKIAAVPGVMPTMSATAMAAPPATATAAEIPVAVANLSVGTVVTGTVIERGARGLVVLRTDKGTIKLQSPIPLRQGSTVTLQIQSIGAQTQLSILSIDGNPLAASSGKPAPSAGRPDGAVKSASGETAASPRTSFPSNGPAQSTPGATNATGDGLGLAARAATGDRSGFNARSTTGVPAAPATAPSANPATAFVARSLIGPTVSANLEAFSAPQPVAAQPTTQEFNHGQPGAWTPAAATMAGTIPAGAASLPTSSAPAQPLTAGDKFIASFLGAPASASPGPLDSPGQFSATPPQSAGGPGITAKPLADASPVARTSSVALPASGSGLSTVSSAAVPAAAAGAPMPAADAVMMLRLIEVELPGSPPTAGNPSAMAKASPSAPQTIVGTIIESAEAAPHPSSTTASPSKILISTPLGVLTMPGVAPGPVGTRLTLELMPLPEPSPAALYRPEPGGSLVMSASGRGPEWAVLRDIITATTVADPELADHLLNVTLPRVGPNFAAGLLVFVAALRQGDPRAWLGERTTDALRQSGHGALLEKLNDEFAALNRLAANTSPSGWQTLLVPLFDGERIQQIRMYMRRARRKNSERGGTRFMIEAELTKLGPVQLDGLISKPQFDLVVRTRKGMPPAMRGDIIEIFGDALLATHLKGGVIFQVTADLRPGPPDIDGDAGMGLIV